MRRLWSILLVAFLVLGMGHAVRAEGASPLSALATSNLDELRRGVKALGQSGDPRALPVIAALNDGALYVRSDRALFIRTPSGFVDAATGAPAPDVTASGLKKVRVSNPVREAINDALGALRLFSPDPTARAAAAAAVFHDHDPHVLAALDRALEKETDPGVRHAMMDARAAALLFTPEASTKDRLDAVARLGARGGVEARGLLEQVSKQSPEVAAAAAAAISSIDRRLQLWSLAQSVYYGISLGSVLLLAAAGLAVTFGVMGVINMAHGEMVMLGAYTTFVVQGLVLGLAPALSGVSLVIAIPASFAVTGALGIVIERTLIRWLYGRPLETLLATFGLSLILQQAVRTVFGASNRAVSTPSWMSGETHLGGLAVTYNRLAIIVFAFLVLAGLAAVIRFTSLGLRMRAVTQNRLMASAMGIRTPRVDALTFGLGSGVAGMAGVALSQIDNVSPNLGQGYIIDSFMVVVFGGVGNLWGTVVGALVLGVVNKFLEPIAGAVLGKIAVLVLLILFIQRKPRGLFPIRGRAVEA